MAISEYIDSLKKELQTGKKLVFKSSNNTVYEYNVEEEDNSYDREYYKAKMQEIKLNRSSDGNISGGGFLYEIINFKTKEKEIVLLYKNELQEFFCTIDGVMDIISIEKASEYLEQIACYLESIDTKKCEIDSFFNVKKPGYY